MSKIIPVRARGTHATVDEAWVGYTVDGSTGVVDEKPRVLIPGKLDVLSDFGISELACVWLEDDGRYVLGKEAK